MTDVTAVRLSAADHELRSEISHFLSLEALLLDEGRFDEWYELLDDELVYEIPTRQATMDRAQEMVPGINRVRDTKPMIRIRIDRLKTGLAWAETPPSRTIRSVGSVVLLDDDAASVIAVSSVLLLYRQRGLDPGEFLHARRNDRIRATPHGMRLLSRSAVTVESILNTPNLSVFL